MTRGRKPHPSHLKIVKGQDRKALMNPNEPEPEIAIPTPPSHLSNEAKAEWDRICEDLLCLGIISELDRAALAAYCQAYGRWQQAECALAKMAGADAAAGGMVIKTKSGNAIHNPLVGIANKAMADMVRYAAEFGMTPSARTRIAAEQRNGKTNPASKYFDG